jgi:hypothetical protein
MWPSPRTFVILLLPASAWAVSSDARFTATASLADPDALSQFELDDASAWAVEHGALVLKLAGKPAGPIRKPARWAILKTPELGDVTLRAKLRCDQAVERKGRDVLLFFGFQSPTRFYYVHLSNEVSYPHNGVFVVNDADRKRLDEQTSEPRLHDREWHDVRLVRDARSGAIEVYLDGSGRPVLTARDATLVHGRVGFGSFDDTAAFKDIVVEGARAPAR